MQKISCDVITIGDKAIKIGILTTQGRQETLWIPKSKCILNAWNIMIESDFLNKLEKDFNFVVDRG